VITAHPRAGGQVGDDDETAPTLPIGIRDDPGPFRGAAVRDADPRHDLRDGYIHSELAAPPARRVLNRVRGQFGHDKGNVVACRALRQERREPASHHA